MMLYPALCLVQISRPVPFCCFTSQDWYASQYTYSMDAPHAVTEVNRGSFADSFVYDENGNPSTGSGRRMECRTEKGISYKQEYNAENRISAIHRMDGNCDTDTIVESWNFVYDGDGVRTTTSHDTGSANISITRYYFGSAYEVTDGAVRKYYSIAGMTVAMHDGDELQYLLTDHLGSVVAVTDDSGTLTSQQRYLPFGEMRTDVPSPYPSPTDYTYTGQRTLDEGMGGIMDYKASTPGRKRVGS